MILLVVNFKVKDGKSEEFLATIKPLITGSQAEAGCIEYNLFADDEKANTYMLFEKWVDQDALDFHNNTEHFLTHGPKLGDLCDEIILTRAVPV